MSHTTFFNAHHSPIGAFATFTFGCKGARGGLGLELAGPANEGIYVGVEDRSQPGRFAALPFFEARQESAPADDYDVEGLSSFRRAAAVEFFPDEQVTRVLGPAIDQWQAGDLTFRVVSRVVSLPDPEGCADEDLRAAVVPAVIAELTVDNTRGVFPRKAFFGYAGSGRANSMRVVREGGLTGVAQGGSTAILCDDESVYAGIAWQPEAILNPIHESNLNFMLGDLGLIVGTVGPGEVRTFRFAICFFREATATTGIRTRYLYRRWFNRIEDVGRAALGCFDCWMERSLALDSQLAEGLGCERALMMSHAIRSYLGSTQLLEADNGEVVWVVNEGEYRMMNTFDLAVDQAFFELSLHGWTVRNALDLFAKRYSYEDEVRFPGDPTKYPGGLAFAHDMGVANAFAEPGRSCYEQAGLRGCFSYMSCEELVNWILCSCLYAHAFRASDPEWIVSKRDTLRSCLQSLANRDNPDASLRNGLMGLDSSRCEGGSEITTYDSLDASLGQARNNVYLAVKAWAAYVLLEPLFRSLGDEDSSRLAADQASRCASTIVSAADEDGFLPAIVGEGVTAKIIPAIEGLAFAFIGGRRDAVDARGPYGALIRCLERHFEAVMKTGICLFKDGGWRLSSTSRNSWLSKIYLCQFIAERILGKRADSNADRAHLSWLMREDNAYYAWSDQMVAGKAVGSRYYPRGVTSILWLADGKGDVLADLTAKLGSSQASEDASRLRAS